MSDLIQRAEQAAKLASSPAVPKWQRLSQALKAFSGLELTQIADDIGARLEADLARVNHVLEQYSLETSDDYEIIDDVDLQRMLAIVELASSEAIAAELDRIVADLDAGAKELPIEAIRETREHRDLMIPKLIGTLENAASAAPAGAIPTEDAHFFALFLLTEFHAEEALPILLECFSLPGELPFDLFGEAVTDTLPRILALFVAERPEVVDGLIVDQTLNPYVRWEAAHTYVFFVRDGHMPRDEAVRRLGQHLRQAIDDSDTAIIHGLICVLKSFAPQEALEDITEAYKRNLVDRSVVDFADVERSIVEGEAGMQRELEWCPATGIEDTIEELQQWAAFSEKPSREPDPAPPSPHITAPFGSAGAVAAPVSSLSRGPRIGRNDPCTCGSGKKYKKCCGARR